ncbi:hypothetical protein AB0P07_27520 [Streptomyces sp. NPDC085944]|uniref:hypothetical protein n=1 Tax=Streptomyces sp. NPDC085944 TaxID=3154962 RepID=UPI003422C9D8
MELSQARVPVAGATGVPGGAVTAEAAARGTRVALAARHPRRCAGAVADALEADAEPLRPGPDGTPVAGRRAR